MEQSSKINDAKIEAVAEDNCYPTVSIEELWRRFNVSANQLSIALGRTSNIVGEYAEYLAKEHYQGCLVRASGASFDFKTANGDRYQVKSRKIKSSLTTQLNVFRSWEFEFLVVILFGEHGDVRKALEVPVDVAQVYAKRNDHQGGWVITTHSQFLLDHRATDITTAISILNSPVD